MPRREFIVSLLSPYILRLKNLWTALDSQTSVNKLRMGYKGGTFLEAGYVYAPYIPLYTTPMIVLDDFVGRKGLAEKSEWPVN